MRTQNQAILPDPDSSKRTSTVQSIGLMECRKNRLYRMFIIVELLDAGITLTAKSISTGFGVSLRTAYRDIKELGSVGIPVSRADGDYKLNLDDRVVWSSAILDAWKVHLRYLEEDESEVATQT